MRARNIKPGLLKNEDLADIGPYAQLLFIGLWQLADREGKLEDRPRRIKAEVFPYYDPKPSITNLLNQLSEKNFIIRYKAKIDGRPLLLIKIVNFEKHQSPHHTEKRSILPEPCNSPLITSDSPSNNGELTVNSPSNNGEYPPDSLNHERGIMNHEKVPLPKKGRAQETPLPLPPDFSISESVKVWAEKKGFDRLEEHLEAFKDTCAANGYKKYDWDATFKKAIREDWGKIRTTFDGKPKEDMTAFERKQQKEEERKTRELKERMKPLTDEERRQAEEIIKNRNKRVQ